MIRSRCWLALVGIALIGCDKGDSSKPAPTASASAAVTVFDAGPPAPPVNPTLPKFVTTWGKDVGLKTPESVIHDETSDVYFVSNVDGKPLDADGKGFISKLAPEAMGYEAKWLESGKKGVTLNAPKGMALSGDVLFVADIDTVRAFDRVSGAPRGEVKIPGATFLNDIVVLPDQITLAVSDTGMKADKDGKLVPAGTDAIYKIDKEKKVTTFAKGAELGHPNGLYALGDKIWVVTFGSNELYALDGSGARTQINKLPKGQLDGIQMYHLEFIISSWEANAIYHGKPGGTFEILLQNQTSPADILVDRKRDRLVIPDFTEDTISAYALPK